MFKDLVSFHFIGLLWLCFFNRGLPGKGLPLVAQTVRKLTTVQETQIQSLGWEDPLEKEMAAHFSSLAWRIPWTEEPGAIVRGVTKCQKRLSN